MAQCEICGSEMVQGRGRARRTCSPACRQAAHRRKQAVEVERLKELAARPAPAPVPEAAAVGSDMVSRNEPAPLEDGGAGLPDGLRVLWLDLRSAVETAARRAESGWDDSEIAPGPDDVAFTIRYRAEKLAQAVLSSAPPSRNEPAEPGAAPAPEPLPGSSRDEPVAVRPRSMSAKRAKEVVAVARLVSRDRETHSYDIVDVDGNVIGHVAPAYKAGRRSGWQGWATGLTPLSNPRRHTTRDQAGADALGQWVRIVTAKPRR